MRTQPEIAYDSATVAISEITERSANHVYSAGNEVHFIWNQRNVRISTPKGIYEIVQIKQEFVPQLVECVKNDLNQLYSLMPSLEGLVNKGNAPRLLMYSIDDETEGKFKVYDVMNDPNGNTFPTLYQIKQVPKNLLNPRYLDLLPVAANVGKRDEGLAYVQGENLGIAVERAIRIYELANRLRGIRDKKV